MSEINLSPLLISKNIKPNCTYSIYIETPKLKLLCYLMDHIIQQAQTL